MARFLVTIGHRWPTFLALGLATLTLWDLDDGVEFAFLILLSAVGYLVITVIDRPGAVWVGLLIMIAAVVLLRVLGVSEWVALIGTAVVFGVVGLIGGQLRRPGLYAVQPLAVLIFGAIAGTAVAVSPDLGRYLVAAGLIGHTVWDAVHWRANQIVTRPFAEWCGVLDLTLGLGILILI